MFTFLLAIQKVERFLSNDNTGLDQSGRYESGLIRGNDTFDNGFQTVSETFGYDFVREIAQADRPELRDLRRVVNFRDESYECLIHFLQ